MPFTFKKCEIQDLVIIEPKVFKDERGFFLESFKKSDFVNNGINEEFCQDNHSLSSKGVLRGLHYQLNPKSQGKLVRVIKGAVWDVAVDIRKNSPSFMKWYGIELSEKNSTMLYIPPGFAHGFITLEDNTHFLYKCTNEFSKEHECGIIWNDKDIAINWPLKDVIVSDKDKILPNLIKARIFE